ncbi:MAG: hypothetical protein FWB98_06375 [Defluviitaleaceae bacterium]|nr:hypothetical protein [Defluviitaleaceae bacterium]
MTHVFTYLDSVSFGIVAAVTLAKFIIEMKDRRKRRPQSKGKRRSK